MSSASGFSRDERSPGSAPSAVALTARRTIFAERVFGSASTKKTRSGLNALPSSAATCAATSASVVSAPGSRQAKIHAVSPLTSCGTPIAAASRTAGWPTAADSSSAEPPCRNQYPSASTEAQSPCTHTSGIRDQYVSMNLSGSRQKPRVMPGNGFRQTSSPTSPVPTSESPVSSTTSIAIPSAGPPTEQALIGPTGVGERKHAPTSVPPVQLITGTREQPTSSKSQRYGSGFHGSPVVMNVRREERSASGAPCGSNA